jgi:hypothetical protein
MIRQPDFSGVWIKVERAKEHISNLEALVKGFIQSNPYEVVPYDEPDTGDLVFKVKASDQPPLWWSGVLGDAVHNLRSSLDLLVCELVRANGERVKPNTGFPVFKSATAAANAFKAGPPGQVKGAPKAAVDLIKNAKPYPGGNDAFWQLHQLDITDKHKLLVAVGSAYRNVIVDLSAIHRNSIAAHLGIDPSEIPSAPVAINPADRQFPLKDGAEVFRIAAAARSPDMDMNPQFAFEVAFGEDEVVKGEPLFPTLPQLVEFVEGFVQLFPRLFNPTSLVLGPS